MGTSLVALGYQENWWQILTSGFMRNAFVGGTIVALAAGLIPLLIFWVEHKVTQRLRAEHPELAPSGTVA